MWKEALLLCGLPVQYPNPSLASLVLPKMLQKIGCMLSCDLQSMYHVIVT